MKIKRGAESMSKLVNSEEVTKQLKNTEAKIAALNKQLQDLKSSPGSPFYFFPFPSERKRKKKKKKEKERRRKRKKKKEKKKKSRILSRTRLTNI